MTTVLPPHLIKRFPAGTKPMGFHDVSAPDWTDWRWQFRQSLKSISDFESVLHLSADERRGFEVSEGRFKVTSTPYYTGLMSATDPTDPLRMMTLPNAQEHIDKVQSQLDPLAERRNQVGPRLVHRYSDRVLLWVTDTCGVYCRYCTRKHFTAQGQAAAKSHELDQAIEYIKRHEGIREVILSGGDPLSVSDEHLKELLGRLRKIEHIELIRIGSRLLAANPFRVTDDLVKIFKDNQPVVFMSHFNHPRELTLEAYTALAKLVDHGVPVFNQMVLLNGINNHPAIIHALSRQLLLARVKPYYMFQCDPSQGTDHLRTSVEQSLAIQKELWGHMSGLAMPNLSLDIPNGGGKAYYVPKFETHQLGNTRFFTGWDGVEAEYISPPQDSMKTPSDISDYIQEWQTVTQAKSSTHPAPSNQTSIEF